MVYSHQSLMGLANTHMNALLRRLMYFDALERDGLAPEDALHASRRALGNVALAVDDARDVWTIRTINSVSQDMRAALRGLRKEATNIALSRSCLRVQPGRSRREQRRGGNRGNRF